MNFKNKKKNYKFKFSKIIEFFKKISIVVFSIQIILVLIFFTWYFNNPVKDKYPPETLFNFLNKKSKNFIGLDFTNINNYLKVYFLGAIYSINKPNVEKINLNIDQEGIFQLEFQRVNRAKASNPDFEIKKKLSTYINGELEINNKSYPIKLRVKGDRLIHYFKPKSTSYKIDLRQGKKIWGLEEFSLQKPVVRNYVHEFIFHKLNKTLGNISLDYRLVNLSINGIDYGLYSIEEGFSSELLEKNARRDGPIFGIRDDVSSLYPNITYESYSEIYWVAQNQSLLRVGYGILNRLKQNDIKASNFIDWDKWAKFFAVVDLSQAYHGALSKSVRIYYNPVTAKIEPISFDGHYGTADFSNFIILDFLKKNSSCSWICGEKEWFSRFLLNEKNQPRKEFIEPYLKYLKILSSKEFLETFEEENNEKINVMNKLFYSDFSRYDNIFWEGIFPYIYEDDFLKNRAEYIVSRLKNTNFSNFQFSKTNNKLKINFSQESLPVKLITECVNFELNQWISNNITLDWYNGCDNLTLEDINLNSKNFYLFDNPSLSDVLPDSFDGFRNFEEIIEGKKIEDNFYPTKEEILIDTNLKLSKNTNLIINEGQKIIIKNNSIFAILGNIKINGTLLNKVKIEGNEPGYGSIISYGNLFDVKHLEIKNLISPNLNGYTLYGGLNIIDSNIQASDILFNNSRSEDALNLINSKSKISNLKFLNSKSDGLDIDSGSSEIKNIYCKNIGNDCVDFSNANILIDEISATNVFDKTVSVGEKSNVKIKNLNIKNSEIGIAVKDNSNSEIKNYIIENTTLPIAVFVKKQEYGPAKLIVNKIKLKKSNQVFLVDNKSYLEISGKRINGTQNGTKIESLLYGNIYGRATLR